LIDVGSKITTLSLSVNFLAPAKPGTLTARGRIFHKGKRTAVGECEVTDANGKVVSKGTATYMILNGERV